MSWTDTLDRPVSSGMGRTAEVSPAPQQTAARPAPDAGRPRREARAVWFAVTAALNSGLIDAVFVVSNDVVRDTVARACGALGVPWYGPTFDS